MPDREPDTDTQSDKPKRAGLAGDPSAMVVGSEIMILAQLIEARARPLLPLQMTMEQFATINHLLRLEKRQTVGELAEAHQVRQSTMSVNVRRLEDLGLVELQPKPDDRRVRYVVPTSRAANIRSEAMQHIANDFEPFQDVFDPAEWMTLENLLYRLRCVLDQNR